MITRFKGNCYNCGSRQFSGLGKYSNWETIVVLVRNWFAEKYIKGEKIK